MAFCLFVHWLMLWPFACWHQAITWNTVDISSAESCAIHLNTMALEMLNKVITITHFINYVPKINITPQGYNTSIVSVPQYYSQLPWHFSISCNAHFVTTRPAGYILTLCPLWTTHSLHFCDLTKYRYCQYYRGYHSLDPVISGCDFENATSNLVLLVLSSDPLDEWHGTIPLICWHWLMLCIGAVRQQANTWANFNPVLCRHMASICYNELNIDLFIWD